jgi:signal transduction histidine kinase
MAGRLLDRSLQAFLLVDGNTRVVRYANDAFCGLVRRPRSEIVGVCFERVLRLVGSADCLRCLGIVKREGVPLMLSVEVDQPESLSPQTWELHLSPVEESKPQARSILIQVTDTTDLVQFREQIVRMNEELMVSSLAHHELAEKAKKLNAELGKALAVRDEFIAIASHELRTSLTSLGLQRQILERTLDASKGDANSIPVESVRKAMAVMNRQSRKLERLIESMLDLSRIEQGRLSMRVEDVDLGGLVTDVVAGMANEFSAAKTSVEVKVEGKVNGRWDPLRVEQVCVNLLSNALKYGENRPVSVSVSRQGANARIIVRDSGVGIAEVDHERIFQSFERAIPYRHISGMGIGLFVAREIAQAHGGSISVTSEPGQGSAFIFELPLHRDP